MLPTELSQDDLYRYCREEGREAAQEKDMRYFSGLTSRAKLTYGQKRMFDTSPLKQQNSGHPLMRVIFKRFRGNCFFPSGFFAGTLLLTSRVTGRLP